MNSLRLKLATEVIAVSPLSNLEIINKSFNKTFFETFFPPNTAIPTSTNISHAKFPLGTTPSNVVLFKEFKSVMDVVVQYHPLVTLLDPLSSLL